MSYRVLVSGFSGPIGTALQAELDGCDATITRLVRRSTLDSAKSLAADEIPWDPTGVLNPALVSGFDAVIHLAGESVSGRWTDAKKRAIRASRVLGTTSLANALAQTEKKPSVLVSASAIGFYGCRGEDALTEASAVGRGFLPEVSQAWENSANAAVAAGIRVLHPRFGIVLSSHGGALGQMLPAFKLGLGGPLGNGRQWFSWISAKDVAGALLHLMRTESLSGPVNLTAPHAVTNAEFTRVLGSVLKRPAILPVPAFALRLIFKDMADEALLCSAKVLPERLLASGYSFRYPDLREALEAAVKSL